MKWLATLLLALLVLTSGAVRGTAQDSAHLNIGATSLTAEGRGWFREPRLQLKLTLDRAVPYRAFLVGDPVRLIVDLKSTDLSGIEASDLFGRKLVQAVRIGEYRQGWSRIVLELPGPYQIASAGQRSKSAEPVIRIVLDPVKEADFEPLPSATTALSNLPEPVALPAKTPDEKLTVVLDPGHGGRDPGAIADGNTEADLVLAFARELRPSLAATGVNVVMTRDADTYVRLENRMTAAREAGADLFISLHADALPSGQAAGATVYVWNPASNDRAAAQLVARHARDDLLSEMDFTFQDDRLTSVIMDFARTDTQPRSENFARFLTSHMALSRIGLHGRPVQKAAFSVLKSPEIPSVLLELGFLSDATDRAKLVDPVWRARMVKVVTEAVTGWAKDEEVRKSGLLK